MKILITGGAGFIGSALIRYLITNTSNYVLNVDKLTYAGNLKSLISVSNSNQYLFKKVDICNRVALDELFRLYQPDAVMHLAAESHVDRSIDSPDAFMQTNIIGTYTLLEVTRTYWESLSIKRRASFRFHHISTDEVYGDLKDPAAYFTETTPYAPSSPYSASKASSDHLVRAWYRTYGLPTIITNCSNNYGPYQHYEKLIPVVILNALAGKPIPIYGSGMQVRDWLYVEDHVRALYLALMNAAVGSTYNIGGHNEVKNIDIAKIICSLLNELRPSNLNAVSRYEELITYTEDRPGHDQRYAIDSEKIRRDLGWYPQETFESGIEKTVKWYLVNQPGYSDQGIKNNSTIHNEEYLI